MAAGRAGAALLESTVGPFSLPRIVRRPHPGADRPGRPVGRAYPHGRPAPGSTPRRSGPVRYADLVEDDTGGRARPVAGVREVLPRSLLLGDDGALWLQTLWAGGRPDRRLWVARRFAFRAATGHDPGPAFERASASVEAEWSARVGRPVRARRSAGTAGRSWTEGDGRGLFSDAWFSVPLEEAGATAEPFVVGPPDGPKGPGPSAVFGAPGVGKTSLLADRAAETIRQGGVVVAIDLHGDLAPAITARLPTRGLDRLVAVDASAPSVGVAALAGPDDRAADHLVAAVKRLTPDGQEIYWGFRLERVYDVFVRLALETGGSLLDVYDLLTDGNRRDAARLQTVHPELGRFLDELGPILKRTPDFLWPAAARLSKVALVPALSALLAPRDGGLDLERLLAEGRSLAIRVPYSVLGTEAAGFAGSLVLARAYYGLLGAEPGRPVRRVLLVLDEVHAFAPRLVAEILTEGRKFGVGVLLASQYPDRLGPELKSAVAGTVREVVAFRAPSASAAIVGGWIGLSAATADAILARLPTGVAALRAPASGELVTVSWPPGPEPDPDGWGAEVARTRAEFGGEETVPEFERPGDGLAERSLLAVLASEEEGRPLARADLAAAVGRTAGPPVDPCAVARHAEVLARRGWLEEEGGRLRLTPAGERFLGLSTSTGAVSETAEHRALLVRTFRLFARRGHRLEIVRQGRFDTRLPDGIVRQLPPVPSASPAELAVLLERARSEWAWRFFGGRDVHVEAEVSGALRPERIRRGVAKARRRGAFPLFVVADAARARRVRRTLRGLDLGVRDAQVWTVRVGPTTEGGRSGPTGATGAEDEAGPPARRS